MTLVDLCDGMVFYHRNFQGLGLVREVICDTGGVQGCVDRGEGCELEDPNSRTNTRDARWRNVKNWPKIVVRRHIIARHMFRS